MITSSDQISETPLSRRVGASVLPRYVFPNVSCLKAVKVVQQEPRMCSYSYPEAFSSVNMKKVCLVT